MFLVRCRDCGSRLLQPVEVTASLGSTSIVTRHCPECGRHDVAVADDLAVQAWLRREERVRDRIVGFADALAAVVAAEV